MMKKLLLIVLALFCCTAAIAETCEHQWEQTDVLETCEAITTVYTCQQCGEDKLIVEPTGEEHPETDCLLEDYCEYWLIGCGYCDEVLSREMGEMSHDYFNPLSRNQCGMVLYTCPRCHDVILRTGAQKARHSYVRKGSMQVCSVCGDKRCYPECPDIEKVWDDFRMLWITTCTQCGRTQTYVDDTVPMPHGITVVTTHKNVRCCILPGSVDGVVIPEEGTHLTLLDEDIIDEDFPSRSWARVVYQDKIGFVPQEYLKQAE